MKGSKLIAQATVCAGLGAIMAGPGFDWMQGLSGCILGFSGSVLYLLFLRWRRRRRRE